MQVVETSQDWLHVRWDAQGDTPSALILTLTGDNQGQALQIDPSATEHAFANLTPDTAYAVRLLAVVDRPRHDPDEHELQKRIAQNKPRRNVAAHRAAIASVGSGAAAAVASVTALAAAALAASPATAADDAGAQGSGEVLGAPFSLPLVSSDYLRFALSGLIARTKKVLLAKFERVGQSFAVLSWVADGDVNASVFEIQLCVMGGGGGGAAGEAVSTRSIPVHARSRAVIKDLAPESRIQCAVRAVTRTNSAACSWCPPVEIVLQPRLVVGLNYARIENSEPQPPVGENYLALSWTPDCAGPDVTFQVRVTNTDDESGDDAAPSSMALLDTAPARQAPVAPAAAAGSGFDLLGGGSALVFETKEQAHTLQGLVADTRYGVRVRSKTVVDRDVCWGAWSDLFVKSTLSPLSITVQRIRENSGIAYWCRNARVRGAANWWDTSTAAEKREDVASISAFQLHLYERMHDSHEMRLIVDEVIPDNQIDFQSCARVMPTLRPDAAYEVCIRANSGLQWGRWSERCRFATKPCVAVKLSHVRESACRLSWDVAAASAGAFLLAAHYIARVTTIRTGDFELVPLTCRAATRAGECIVSGFEPNTAYSIALRSQFADGECGPWGATAYLVTQAPLEVDVANVSETFANISWRRAAQHTIADDLRARRQATLTELDRSIDQFVTRRNRAATSVTGSFGAFSGGGGGGAAGSSSAAATAAFSGSGSGSGSPSSTARLDLEIDALVRKRAAELDLTQMHGEELDEVAAYAEGAVARVEVVCENRQTGHVLESRAFTKAETLCRQASLECNTSYLVKVRTLVVDDAAHPTTTTRLPTTLQPPQQPVGSPSVVALDRCDDDAAAFADDRIVCLPSSRLGEQARVATHARGLFGLWHAIDFATLKPITLFLRAVGSESAVFRWDTGASDASSSRRTAITAFNVKVHPHGAPGEQTDATLRDPAASGHIVRDLLPNTDYTATVRVCYEGTQWGGWSEPVHFSTLDLLQCKIASLDENLARILVWRVTGPNTPSITSHQLLVNGVMCPDAFEIERGASTVLTMDSLALDSEFTVEIADFVCPGEWQRAKQILRFESLPRPLADLRLLARRDMNIYTLQWSHEASMRTQYVFCVQRAVVGPRALSRGVEPEFETLAMLVDQTMDLELPPGVNIDWYLFRLRVAKLRQTLDGEPLPPSQLVCVQPHNILPALDGTRLRWSGWSPPLRLPHPHPPEAPEHLQLRSVLGDRATLSWAPCGRGHGDVMYHVYLCPVAEDAHCTCVGSTMAARFECQHLAASTRYKVHVVAENNFGRSGATKKLGFTTRFDPAAMDSGGGGHRAEMIMARGGAAAAASSNTGVSSTSALLRAVRGLPSR